MNPSGGGKPGETGVVFSRTWGQAGQRWATHVPAEVRRLGAHLVLSLPNGLMRSQPDWFARRASSARSQVPRVVWSTLVDQMLAVRSIRSSDGAKRPWAVSAPAGNNFLSMVPHQLSSVAIKVVGSSTRKLNGRETKPATT
jgi:hypothetical protein